ncbi:MULTISPECIES: hypothetical protein [unclassified Streptomyces]|uniref:hypothetical protein n=1 Tax=unclassified Streptomyces TaxID=2593676 RepID=UPI00057E8083|nr:MULTISPECIES: hypothetical protein [unclassified Streptomyces]AJC56508.1 hypothetical protein GZL_03922 [Streptomyces sp. 769]UJB43525.1 hypothetical protein HRD51_24410 [Streptomyces sp. A1-5]
MNRHPFEPGRLITGAATLAVGTGYGLDALGLWHAPRPWLFLALPAGLLVAGITTAVWATVRRHHQQDAPPPQPS